MVHARNNQSHKTVFQGGNRRDIGDQDHDESYRKNPGRTRKDHEAHGQENVQEVHQVGDLLGAETVQSRQSFEFDMVPRDFAAYGFNNH